MELDSNQILLDLVKGQEHTQTMVKAMSERLFGSDGQTGVLMAMHQEQKDQFKKVEEERKELAEKVSTDQEKLDKRIEGVERKIWYATGFGAALGAVASFIGFKIHH